MPLNTLESEQSCISRSLQVINGITCVIRELVENAIDAESTKIEIKVYNGGVDLIKVTDDGCGISERNFENLALKHATSKIRNFEDLFSSLTTFGFRGEALHALCNLSDLEIETRTDSTDHGWLLKFDTFGKITSKSPVATNVGTSVMVKRLFKDYPVRRKLLISSSKNQITKSVSQIQQYALINPAISFSFTTVSNKNVFSNIFSTSGTKSELRGVVEEIFGLEFSKKLIDIQIDQNEWRIEGLVSNPYNERGFREMEYFYINKRPITKLQKFKNAISSVFSQFSSRSRPSFILNLTIEYDNLDINLSPDKKSAFIYSEDRIVRLFKENLYQILKPKPNLSQINSEMMEQFIFKYNATETNEAVDTSGDKAEDKKRESSKENESLVDLNCVRKILKIVSNKTLEDYIDKMEDVDLKEGTKIRIDESRLFDERRIAPDEEEDGFGKCVLNTEDLVDHNFLNPKVFEKMELIGQFSRSFIITKLTFPEVKSKYNFSLYVIDQHAADEKARFERLNRTVRMKRQSLITPKLIQLPPFLTQVFNRLKLLFQIAEDNIDLLSSNGFEVKVKRESLGSKKGVYLHTFPILLGKVLGEEEFVDFVSDLSGQERVEKRKESEFIWGMGSIPRPHKIWSILASKSCKSSVRAGDALTNGKMRNIVMKMGTLIHPWNCPHGRPSIKCLVSHHQLQDLLNNNL